MNFRSCAYVGCENYVMDGVPSGKFTLFSFPKDPERRNLWMKLGKVSNNLANNNYFMCSVHFDKKYLSVNHRRTLLVGPAKPFPHISLDEQKDCGIDEKSKQYIIVNVDAKKKAQNKDPFLVESTTTTFETLDDSLPELTANEAPNSDEELYLDELPDHIINTSPEPSPIKKPRIIVEKNQTIMKSKEVETTQLPDQQKVTTFIFKGEEYVQMPKDYYTKEKSEMLQKLKLYENIIKEIKINLNKLDSL